MSFTLGTTEVLAFSRENKAAMLLVKTAVSDYAACRCCLLNGLFTGFVLGSQAAEKMMKAVLLIHNPSTNPKNFGHGLAGLRTEIEAENLMDLSSHRHTIEKLDHLYQRRYPDNLVSNYTASNSECKDIDSFIMQIVEDYAVPLEIKLSSGVYSAVINAVYSIGDVEHPVPESKWLLTKNSRLLELMPVIQAQAIEWASFLEKGQLRGKAL